MAILTAEPSQGGKNASTVESNNLGVNGVCTHPHCTQDPDLSRLTQVFWPAEKGYQSLSLKPWGCVCVCVCVCVWDCNMSVDRAARLSAGGWLSCEGGGAVKQKSAVCPATRNGFVCSGKHPLQCTASVYRGWRWIKAARKVSGST